MTEPRRTSNRPPSELTGQADPRSNNPRRTSNRPPSELTGQADPRSNNPRRTSNRPPSELTGHAAPAPIDSAPLIQIFGFNDCPDSRKALRFFSERRRPVHFVNLQERPATRGELRRFEDKLGAAALVDRARPRFRALGLHVSGDSPQRLLERALAEPRLLRTPLVRIGHRVSVGHAPEEWQAALEA